MKDIIAHMIISMLVLPIIEILFIIICFIVILFVQFLIWEMPDFNSIMLLVKDLLFNSVNLRLCVVVGLILIIFTSK